MENPHITYRWPSVSAVPPHPRFCIWRIQPTLDRVVQQDLLLKKIRVEVDRHGLNPCCSRVNCFRGKHLFWTVRNLWQPIREDTRNIIREPALQLHQKQPLPLTPTASPSDLDCKNLSFPWGKKSYTAFDCHPSAEFPDQERTH